ncbi:MAG: hypothetical protein H7A36_07125 [Chlamydiales bacterium]|nr:hypothetical protein [Chlamydiales bacterium]
MSAPVFDGIRDYPTITLSEYDFASLPLRHYRVITVAESVFLAYRDSLANVYKVKISNTVHIQNFNIPNSYFLRHDGIDNQCRYISFCTFADNTLQTRKWLDMAPFATPDGLVDIHNALSANKQNPLMQERTVFYRYEREFL